VLVDAIVQRCDAEQGRGVGLFWTRLNRKKDGIRRMERLSEVGKRGGMGDLQEVGRWWTGGAGFRKSPFFIVLARDKWTRPSDKSQDERRRAKGRRWSLRSNDTLVSLWCSVDET
jgi:hypothetical protein